MKMLMPTAAALSLLLATACSDRGTEKSQEFAEEQVAPTTSTPATGSPEGMDSAVPMDRDLSARADTSTRTTRKNNTARRTTSAAARVERDVDAPREKSAAPITSLDHRRPEAAATPAPAPRAQWRELTVPNGTTLPLELETALSSETAHVETPVRARLRNAVVVNGYTAIPAGAVFVGTVTDVERAGRVKGRSRLAFRFNEVQMDNGREDLQTNVITYEGEQSKGEDATKVGAGAGIGAIIGGIAGGAGGAAKGAVIGGAAGTGAVLATRGKEVKLAAGTDIAASLADSVKIRVPAN
jgi:hypothetical protein